MFDCYSGWMQQPSPNPANGISHLHGRKTNKDSEPAEHLHYKRNWCQDTVRMYNRKWNVILPIKIDDLCLTKREMERYREKSFNRFLQKSFKVDFPEKKEVLMAFLSYPFSLEHFLQKTILRFP